MLYRSSDDVTICCDAEDANVNELNSTVIDIEEKCDTDHKSSDNLAKEDIPDSLTVGITEVDSPPNNTFASKKGIAEGMMDIALLTANANQLRFLLSYNSDSKTFYISVGLIVTSLIIQIAVGIALIFKSQMKIRGKRHKASKTNDFLVGGVFLVTVINVFAASFTTTDKVN